MIHELVLFAGAGGGILGGTLLGWRTVCAVEADPYRRAVLMQRQNDGILPPFPIWDDIKTFDGREWRGLVDVVSAGFPCQPFSLAGKRRADADERNLWPDTIRIIREVRPRFALLENVPGLLYLPYWGTVLGDLAESGYDAEWTVLGADDVGAPHHRKRLWILAYTRRALLEVRSARQRNGRRGAVEQQVSWWNRDPAEESAASESFVGRVADGVAHRVDRLAALGDGQVPAVVRAAWTELLDAATETAAAADGVPA